jgi:rfaE bifunctional protein kinase chain/domain
MPSAGRERRRVKKKPASVLDPAVLRRARVLVVGDVMLDRYWIGEVSRISPEAPVPVVRIQTSKTDERPGGAANVARNAAALGARVDLLSVIGDDEAGAKLAALLAAQKVRARLHRDRSVETTVKLRVVGPGMHQLLRIDFEKPPSREVLAGKLAEYAKMLEDCDLVVLSDYGKGGLAHIAKMIQLARARRKPVLVDPKGDDYSRYVGATVVTPYRNELREVVGSWRSDREMEQKAQRLRRDLRLEALLVTLGEQGMALFRESGVRREKAQAREVYDVSGAGDTVIATLAVMLAGGAPLEKAMRVANHAAGIVVGKFGAAVVLPKELRDAMKDGA